MASAGQSLRIGPFRGGLNTASDPTAIADTELADCVNFDIDIDGSLTSRPPVTSLLDGPRSGETVDMLGYFVSDTGTAYLLASTDEHIWYFGSGTWVQIATGRKIRAMVQYNGLAWLIADHASANDGGSWDPPAVFGDPGTFTAIATMPRGGAAAIYKERLFIAPGPHANSNTSRLFFSALADPTSWPGSNFIDISPGDGQKLLDIFVVSSNMYLFKNDSTYVYTYDSAPDKGVVNTLSKTIGVSYTGCVDQYEDVLYIYHEDFVYELINYKYTKLNIKVNFSADLTGSTVYHQANALSVVGDRIVVRYFDKVYVFSTKTRTWSRWVTTRVFSRLIQEPRPSNTTALQRYVSGSAIEDTRATYVFQEGFDVSASESMTCSVTTKVFDFDTPDKFKKLYWWGIDIISSGTVTGTVVPVVYTFNVTWGSLISQTWGAMTAFTWAQPSTVAPQIVDVQNTAGSVSRKFLKFLKAIRFRSVFFQISLTADGTTATSPVKIFTLNPVIGIRQAVPKEIN